MAEAKNDKAAGDQRRELAANNRGVIVSVISFSFELNVLAFTGSLFMLQVYDRVIPSGSIPTQVAFSLIVGVLHIYYGAMDYARSRIFVRIGRIMLKVGLESSPSPLWPALPFLASAC